MSKFNAQEKVILDAFESGELKQSKHVKIQIKLHKTIADTTFKNKPLTGKSALK